MVRGLAPAGAGLKYVARPGSPYSPGVPGQMAVDGNRFYLCVATDTWRRRKLRPLV